MVSLTTKFDETIYAETAALKFASAYNDAVRYDLVVSVVEGNSHAE